MEVWLIIIVSFLVCIFLKYLLDQIDRRKKKLPPGPPGYPLVGNLELWRNPIFFQFKRLIKEHRPKFGDIITFHLGPCPLIFINSHDLAHKALIQKGSIFADRPPATGVARVISSNQHSINTAPYGPLWRLLRRNLMSEILHPSRVKTFSEGREWVLELLVKQLRSYAQSGEQVCIVEDFRFAMFSLLLFMCLGRKLDEKSVKDVETVQRKILLAFPRLSMLSILPVTLGKIIFHQRWKEFMEMNRRQREVLLPLIKARIDQMKQSKEDFQYSYVDSLLNLNLPEGGRNLNDNELVTLCAEFLNGGTDTTTTELQWIMANLVKYPDIQSKLFNEIRSTVVSSDEFIGEDVLQNLPYLKAVVMEGLRRHPPGHYLLPHTVTEEITFEGFKIPKNAVINFSVMEMGMDEKVWKNPDQFMPERFLHDDENTVDLTGTREIKMMPFGAGRRICPGMSLAMLHLEYFIANLVKEFEWQKVEGEDVDFTESQELTTVMKYPLRVRLLQRERW